MNRGNFRLGLGAMAVLLLGALPVSAADLLSIFDQALINDPQLREAEATRMAQREARPLALSALLPQVSGSVGRSHGTSKGDSSSSIFNGTTLTPSDPPPSSGHTNTSTWGLNLRQNLFSWSNWVALRTADSQIAQAEADYLSQRQQLAQRVAQQYFAVLNAQDNIEARVAASNAIARQLEQAEQRFEVGLIAITDVEQARADRDSAVSEVIAAKRALASAEEQLRATIGELPRGLKRLPDDMPLLAPNPASVEDWVRLSLDQNASLISSRLAADIARNQVETAFSGHLPTLDLSVGRNHNGSRGSTTYDYPSPLADSTSRSDSTSTSNSISLTLSIPIFSGGAVSARERQSQYLWIAAKERLDRTSRNTERSARDAFLGVNSEIERVKALKQAVESNRVALEATETGYEVGTRTAVDVLTQRRLLVQAQTTYSSAKYSYLNTLIQLRLAAGNLERDAIAEINNLLTVAPAAQ